MYSSLIMTASCSVMESIYFFDVAVVARALCNLTSYTVSEDIASVDVCVGVFNQPQDEALVCS